ncbi:MAG: hypothetical protein Q9216_004205 [Gyalolechia sp. 2 TL-2023]
MTTWGPNLYQSDAELDTLDLIANEAAGMFLDPDSLRCPLMPEYFSLRSPIDKVSSVQELNNGIFQRLLRRFKHAKMDLAVVMLAAVGMELGVIFKEEDTLVVQMAVMNADMGKERKEQMVEALEGYKNDGTVWEFRSRALVKPAEETLEQAVYQKEESEEPKGGESLHWAIDGIDVDTAACSQVEKESEATTQKPLPVPTHNKATKHSQNDNPPKKELKSALKKPGNEKNVAFRLPKSKSQPSLRGHGRKESKDNTNNKTPTKNTSSKKTTKESLFALPVRGKAEDDKETLPLPLDHTESIFRLPAPKFMMKGRRKEDRKPT